VARLVVGAQHGQQTEGWFSGIPGSRSSILDAGDARGLLWSSIYDDNCVLFFEHVQLYNLREELPEELEPFRSGRLGSCARATT